MFKYIKKPTRKPLINYIIVKTFAGKANFAATVSAVRKAFCSILYTEDTARAIQSSSGLWFSFQDRLLHPHFVWESLCDAHQSNDFCTSG